MHYRQWRWLAVLASLVTGATAAPAASVQRVSVSSTGAEGNFSSCGCGQLSRDGRYVAFHSNATTLCPIDNNPGDPTSNGAGGTDFLLRDRATGTTELISVSSTGEQSNAMSQGGSVSDDGRFVAFASGATNLAPGLISGYWNVFVRDRLLGTTEVVSVSSTGSLGDGSSYQPSITGDGRYVVFCSYASNLVPGDTNGYQDLFVRDRVAGTTERVNVGSAGQQATLGGPFLSSISADGRYVAFPAAHVNGTEAGGYVFVRDRLLGTTEPQDMSSMGVFANGESQDAVISATGRFVLFATWADNLVPGDTNDFQDVFVRDRELQTTERVSVSSSGGQGIGPGEEGTGREWGGVSADGRYAAFMMDSNLLVPEDNNHLNDAFLRDRVAGTTVLANVSMSGGLSTGLGGGAFASSMSDDGVCVLFMSGADDLAPSDTNRSGDVFVYDRLARYHDVPSCYWAFSAIEGCVAGGIVVGYPDLTYRPIQVVTRDQMAVYVARALAGGDAHVPTGPATATFTDVPTRYWAYRHVEYAVDQGVVVGYDADTYGPTDLVDRGQMAVFMARALVAPGGDAAVPDPATGPTFSDVATDFWAYKHVEYCVAQGVVHGYGDGTYRPGEAVTRDQMAVYVGRAFGLGR